MTERITEKIIRAEGVDLAELYGRANRNLQNIASRFPKLKIVARGTTLKIVGEETEIERFDKKFTELTAYYSKYGHISDEVIDQVYSDGMPRGKKRPKAKSSYSAATARSSRPVPPISKNWCASMRTTTCCSLWVPPDRARPIRP